jgi:hypothetical protein
MKDDKSTFQKLRDRPGLDLMTLALPADAIPFTVVRTESPARRKRREHFVKLPWTWVGRLMSARQKATWPVAVVILYEHWRRKGKTFALSNSGPMADISRWRKYRALVELEALGLIAVERRPDKAPLVRVL